MIPSGAHGGRSRQFAIAWPMAVLLALLIGLPGHANAQQTGSVAGRVTSVATGTPLAGATVELVHASGSRAAVTDPQGRYTLRQVPAGRALIRVRHLGHDPFEFEVLTAAGRQITVDLTLMLRPVALDPVHVDGSQLASGRDTIAAPEPELSRATTRVFETAPALSEVGVADAARGIPGHDPQDPGSVLFVRGAASDLKLVYLDGAPVYAPFPLGGLLDPFAPELLGSADIYLGGAPARYDGGLSYVMDLRTRAAGADRFRTSGSADILSASVMAEAGDGDRYGALASVRGMHPLASSDLFGAGLPYDYSEGLLRGDVRLGENASLSLTGFANNESVLMTEQEGGNRTIDWGNRAGSVRLNTSVAGTAAEVTASIGHYEATLPFGGENPLLAQGTADRVRLSADLARAAGDLAIRYGASVEEQAFRAGPVEPPVSSVPSYSMGAVGRVIGGYGELSFQPLPRVRLRGGARLDHFSTSGQVEAAPRVSATWLVTDKAAITVAGGVYHQFLKPPDEVLLTSTSTSDLRIQRPLLVGSASHVTATLDQDFGDGMRFGLEGFYKRFSNLPSASAPEANASGVDLWLRRTSDGISGWFGYSLAWVWSATGQQAGQSDFTGRHLLSTGLEVPIGERTGVEFRFAYGAGLPYAGIPLKTNLQGGTTEELSRTVSLRAAERGGTESAPLLFTPDEPYIRIDAALSRRWTSTPGGRTMDIVPFLRVINGLGNRDGLFYFLDKAGGDLSPTPVGGLPLIPILGVEWRY